MPDTSRPHGQVRPAPATVNAAIRRLMAEPSSARRTRQYERLLRLWNRAVNG